MSDEPIDPIDALIREFNVLIVNTCEKRGFRVMKFANCVVYAFEDIGGLQINEMHENMIKRLAKLVGYRTTILDLTACNAGTSTVLGYWADIITQVKINGGRVILVSPNEFVSRSIRMVGLDKLCDWANSLEKALESVNQQARAGG